MSDHRPAQDQTTEQLPDSNTHLTGRASFRHHMDPSSHGHTTWRDSCWWRFVLQAPHTCWPQLGCQCSHSDAHSKPSPGCAVDLCHACSTAPRVPTPALHLHFCLHPFHRSYRKLTCCGIASPTQQAAFGHAETCS